MEVRIYVLYGTYCFARTPEAGFPDADAQPQNLKISTFNAIERLRLLKSGLPNADAQPQSPTQMSTTPEARILNADTQPRFTCTHF